MASIEHLDLSNIDWTLSNNKLAHILHTTKKTVKKYRIRHNIPFPNLKPGRPKGGTSKGSGRKPLLDPNHEFYMVKDQNGKKKPSKKWRKNVILIQGEACKLCGYHNPPVKNHAHHIIPISEGGKNTLANAIMLCSRCHLELHSGLIIIPQEIKDNLLYKIY